jgi:tRNA A-37 threonylcarbamoyl transferase component Bud32
MKKSYNENKPLLSVASSESSSSSSSSSSESESESSPIPNPTLIPTTLAPKLPVLLPHFKETNIDPVFITDGIVDCIIRQVQKAEIYNLTHWDTTSRFMLKNIITNIHNENYKEYLKDFIAYKHQFGDATNFQSHLKRYGMFKHKYFNLMFRIDNVDDQIAGEEIVRSNLLKKYDNNYQDVIRLGIVIPVHCHIKLSTPQLFYSVQPFITNGVTLDIWIQTIQNKGKFDEVVYDVLIQLSIILKELHEVDCVHGDIKPSNILIVQQQTKNNEYYNNISVFLIDFGLSGIHEKTTNASGGTLPFCAPETENTIANTRDGNDVIKYPQNFEYNWLNHNKSHDIWSLGFLFLTIYIFKDVKLYYHDYPSDFFTSKGYISPKYLNMVKHEYIRDMFSEHILVEQSKRCDIFELNDIVSNLSFM